MSERTSIHGQWSSRLIFVLAAAGSAVGLGNIWKFPYITGEYGGGAFVLVYLLCIIGVGLPIMMAEIILGRRGGLNPVGTFGKLAEGHVGGVRHQDPVVSRTVGEPEDVGAPEDYRAVLGDARMICDAGICADPGARPDHDKGANGGIFAAGCSSDALDVNRAVQSATASALRAIQVVNRVAGTEG